MFAVVVAFTLYVLFFNENSFGRYNALKEEINRLKQEIATAQDTLDRYRMLNMRLETSTAELERIVREQYHLQRPHEDVYIIE